MFRRNIYLFSSNFWNIKCQLQEHQMSLRNLIQQNGNLYRLARETFIHTVLVYKCTCEFRDKSITFKYLPVFQRGKSLVFTKVKKYDILVTVLWSFNWPIYCKFISVRHQKDMEDKSGGGVLKIKKYSQVW